MKNKIQKQEDADGQLELFGDVKCSASSSECIDAVAPGTTPDLFLGAETKVAERSGTFYSEETLEKACELFARKASYKTVANSLGVPVYTARDWFHRYRDRTLQSQEQSKSKRGRLPQSVKDQVIRMRTQMGMSYNKIVAETGVSRATVRSWLKPVSREQVCDEDLLSSSEKDEKSDQ